jgi:hypothetical protein
VQVGGRVALRIIGKWPLDRDYSCPCWLFSFSFFVSCGCVKWEVLICGMKWKILFALMRGKCSRWMFQILVIVSCLLCTR